MMRFVRCSVLLTAAVAAAGCGSVYVVPEDVTGTIVDYAKTPWPGRQILVGDTLTTTDEAGRFTVNGVTPPYDLAIVSFGTQANVYRGMTDPAPTVVSPGIAPGSPVQAGTTTLTVALPDADTGTVVGWVVLDTTDNLTQMTSWIVTPAPGPVRTYTLDWAGPPSASVRIRAFQVQVDPATSAPVHYLGYDATDLALVDKGNLTWAPSYAPPPFSESTLSVSVSLPAGYAVFNTTLLTGPMSPAESVGSKAAGPDVALVMPDLPGAPLSLLVDTFDGTALSSSGVPGIAAGTQKVAVQVEPAPTVTSPPMGATLGIGATVTWTPGGAGVPFTHLYVGAGQEMQWIRLVGGEDGTATVPDLSVLGLSLLPGAPSSLRVCRDNGAPTVEGFASRSLSPGPWAVPCSAPIGFTTP